MTCWQPHHIHSRLANRPKVCRSLKQKVSRKLCHCLEQAVPKQRKMPRPPSAKSKRLPYRPSRPAVPPAPAPSTTAIPCSVSAGTSECRRSFRRAETSLSRSELLRHVLKQNLHQQILDTPPDPSTRSPPTSSLRPDRSRVIPSSVTLMRSSSISSSGFGPGKAR